MLWCANTERLYRFAQTHSVHMHSFLELIIVQKNEKNQLQDIDLVWFLGNHIRFFYWWSWLSTDTKKWG